MLYQDTLIEIENGLSLYVPDPELVKSTYENLLAADAATSFPFWAKIWPAALALSSFLKEEQQYVKGKRVLEIGAGIGLPSFAVAHHAAEMMISDYAEEAVLLIEKNIQHLGLQNVKAIRLDWNHFPDSITAETLLLSDINYAPAQFNALLVLMRNFLEQGTTIILTTPQRITVTPFAEVLQPFIKQSVLQTVTHTHSTIDIRILVLSL